MGEALKGTDRPLVVTSGMFAVQKGEALVIETDVAIEAAAAVMPRCMSELGVLSLPAQGVHVSVVRHPLVHKRGDHGFIVAFIGIASRCSHWVTSVGANRASYFGWMPMFAGLTNQCSSKQTQEESGWTPVEQGLIADLESDDYFQSPNRCVGS